MSESVPIGLKRVAIALADELDYARAAEKLNITSAELQKEISTLESLLCLYLFKPSLERRVELTADGEFLIKAFREAIAVHYRNAGKEADEGQ